MVAYEFGTGFVSEPSVRATVARLEVVARRNRQGSGDHCHHSEVESLALRSVTHRHQQTRTPIGGWLRLEALRL